MTDLKQKIVAVATVFTVLFGMAGPAIAATAEELQASIDALMEELADLQAELAELTGEVVTECCTFTRNLYPGITGDDVKCLQEYLNAVGYTLADSGAGSPGSETTYFGSLTRAAVKAWQDANDVEYGVWWGYFGPISQAKYDEVCVAEIEEEEEEEEEEVELEGGAGSIADADWISGYSNEEVGEGEEDVIVAGLDIEAAEGSDIMLTAVRLVFTQDTADRDFDKYAEEVSLWFEGEEVARLDADDFNDDNNYSRTLSLESGAIIRDGEEGELVVAVSGISNLDSGDEGETWTVEFETVRFTDAQGSSTSDSDTGDINTATRTFSFETFATAADIELKIKEADNDAVNKAHMINVHTAQDTDGVALLDFTLENEGDSDLEFREFGVDFVVTGAADVDEMIAGDTSPAAYLYLDGESYGTPEYHETAAQDRQIMWDDVDFSLDAGETAEGQVEVDLLDIGLTLNEGDTILAQITEIETDDTVIWDVRDEDGEQVADADITGTATGEANEVYDVTFAVSDIGWVTTSISHTDTTGIDEQATFGLSFDITAEDGNVYIDENCTEDSDGTPSSNGMNYSSANCNGTDDFSFSCLVSSTADAGVNNNYEVVEGETESFTYSITVTADQTEDDTTQLTLEGIEWSEADEAGDRLYTGNLDIHKSEGVFLNDR